MTYYIDPFGCAKNQVDAENMMSYLDNAGWNAAENSDDANLIIVNSCGFIESAKQESINAILGWRKLYPEKKILLAGCLSQRYAKELAESLPEADGFFGNSDLSGIIEAAAQTTGANQAQVATTESHDTGKRPLLSLPGQAYVKISEGCSNRCSYCAIPLIRGNLHSRGVSDIVAECKSLLQRGVKELCLVGQDTGSFGSDLADSAGSAQIAGAQNLPGLLKTIAKIEGNFFVRLLYIHPDHFPLEILDIMENDSRFLPYFDIPFQHASQKILSAMGRRGNADIHLNLIKTIRGRFPDAAIRSTFMLGFPGETEDNFIQLLDFQANARLDWLGCFAYSREENTPAWNMKGRVSKKTAAERKKIIEERQVPITENQMERFIGKSFDVLIEEKFISQEEEELYLGRLPFQAPDIDGSAVVLSSQALECGTLVPCRVFARSGFDLQVRPLNSS
ncbi:MAG: 30S ribosomal protein S12 methylthiotransferase RimO [Treponema sp.]|jgi:ribosomal protein S12 methylthiotransferase|nr:30S ribosomal protein S12 methylthiotransferase RimO [Treponema sp.]